MRRRTSTLILVLCFDSVWSVRRQVPTSSLANEGIAIPMGRDKGRHTATAQRLLPEGPTCPSLEYHEQVRQERLRLLREAQSRESLDIEEEGAGDQVGLPYQEETPLLVGHNDLKESRDARSYAAEAARCLTELDVDAALVCYEEALKLEPFAGWLLDAYGSLLADLGRAEEAEKVFCDSLKYDPDGSHVKYMYLAQLYQGQEGISLFRRGIGVLERQRGSLSQSGDLKEEMVDINSKLCSARSALAEALLANDDTGGADDEAEKELELAVHLDTLSPEPFQVMASLRLSQERREDAVACLHRLTQLLNEAPLQCRPSIDFRLQSAKLLIEAELLPECVRVLKSVQEENDSVAELWYLYCFAYRLMGKEKKVQEAAQRGKLYLRTVGGSEQARHPISGELLLASDFDEVVNGMFTTDKHLEALQKRDKDEEEEANLKAMAGGDVMDDQDEEYDSNREDDDEDSIE